MLVVSNVVPTGVPDASERLESALSEVASLAAVLVEEGYAVGLSTADGGIRPEIGQQVLSAILEHLAMLPVRELPPGTHFPMFHDRLAGGMERYAVVTCDQDAAGFPVDADSEAMDTESQVTTTASARAR